MNEGDEKAFKIEIPRLSSLIGLSNEAWRPVFCSKSPCYSEVQSHFRIMALAHAGILTYYGELKVPSPQNGSSNALTEM